MGRCAVSPSIQSTCAAIRCDLADPPVLPVQAGRAVQVGAMTFRSTCACALLVLTSVTIAMAGTGERTDRTNWLLAPYVARRYGVAADYLWMHSASGTRVRRRVPGMGPLWREPLFPFQRYLRSCRFIEAWPLCDSNTRISVAVIERHFDLTHPDLGGVLARDAAVKRKVRTLQRHGRLSSAAVPAYPRLRGRHGNQVLGVLAATHGNGVGILGAAPGVIVRAISARTTVVEAAEAIRNSVKEGCRVMNLSWNVEDHPALRSALRFASMAGCVVVMAPPNEPIDLDDGGVFPSCYRFPGMITVVASSLNEPYRRLPNSAWGKQTAHVAAPGEHILTTSLGSGYSFAAGTSVAAPMVSAAAAMILKVAPFLDGKQVVEIIIETAQRRQGLAGACSSGGLLDAAAAVSRAREIRADQIGETAVTLNGGSACSSQH